MAICCKSIADGADLVFDPFGGAVSEA